MSPKISLLRGTSVIAFATVVSRILGLVRDLLVAALFGASYYADAFFVAFRIPNLLRSFVAEGALTSAFVPVFSAAIQRGEKPAQESFQSVFSLMLLVTIFLTVLCIIFCRPIVSVIAPGFAENPAQFELAVNLTRLMLPFTIFVSVVALVNGALNGLGVFGAAAWAQVWMNLSLILGAVLAFSFESKLAAFVLAGSVLFGGLIQVLVQIPALHKKRLSLRVTKKVFSHDSRSVVQLMGPALIGASIYQLSIFFNTLCGSLLPQGSISWLFYADRLAQLPIGIFTVSLASALLPKLSQAHIGSDPGVFNKSLESALKFTTFIVLPVSAFLFAAAEPLVALCFERGAFNHDSTLKTALALQALCLGLWATSCYSMLVRSFIARRDTVTPVIVGFVSLLIGSIAGVLLMGPVELTAESSGAVYFVYQLQGLIPDALKYNLGHVGLAAGSSISSIVSLLLLTVIAFASGKFPVNAGVAISIAKSAIISFVVWLAVDQLYRAQLIAGVLFQVAALITAACITFLIAAKVFGSNELEDSLKVITKRVGLGKQVNT